ncbi:hypothetical protein [Vallitalea maricola]|uniref:Uncharacterized protein n=1 Tax=Vallitalea maricola TaxID=3074433 RepID=A0ACB5ULT8_9FIRM|nr:hypothetical protein AN2V17_30630 [Vallitalea sp. AN17-2]
MSDLINLYNIELAKYNNESKKQITKFIKKLETFVHAPTNTKEIERMRPFSVDKNLVKFVLGVLEKYYIQKNKLYFNRLSGEFSNYDVREFWYSFCILLLSSEKEGSNFVETVVNDFINMNHPDFHIVRRLFLYIDDNTLNDLEKVVFNHYNNIQMNSHVNKWAENVGLVLPSDILWQFYFYITTENDDFSLLFDAGNPDGVGLGWRIQLYNKKDREDVFSVRRSEIIDISINNELES